MPHETEIKIRIAKVEAVRKQLRELRFRIHKRRVFESNVILDTKDHRLGGKGALVRIRRAGKRAIITYKGPAKAGRHSSREEIETIIVDPAALETIISRLGLNPVFRYEKYRTEYERRGQQGIVTIDETPVGNYLEIEGAPNWIDKIAGELGFSHSDYITENYSALYTQYCLEHGSNPAQMMFPSREYRKTQRPRANT